MRRLVSPLLLMLFCAILAAGCARVQSRARVNDLEQRIQAYAAAIRWGYYDTALHFIHRRQGDATRPDKQRLKDIRVTDYNFTDKVLSDDGHAARVVVAFHYYHVDSGVIRSHLDIQSWWYDEEAGSWMLDGDIPDFPN